VVAAALVEAARRRIQVREALRVEAGRWWSYLCDQPECCPATGTRFDPSTSAVAARMTVAGFTALPDRRALARPVGAPVRGRAGGDGRGRRPRAACPRGPPGRPAGAGGARRTAGRRPSDRRAGG